MGFATRDSPLSHRKVSLVTYFYSDEGRRRLDESERKDIESTIEYARYFKTSLEANSLKNREVKDQRHAVIAYLFNRYFGRQGGLPKRVCGYQTIKWSELVPREAPIIAMFSERQIAPQPANKRQAEGSHAAEPAAKTATLPRPQGKGADNGGQIQQAHDTEQDAVVDSDDNADVEVIMPGRTVEKAREAARPTQPSPLSANSYPQASSTAPKMIDCRNTEPLSRAAKLQNGVTASPDPAFVEKTFNGSKRN